MKRFFSWITLNASREDCTSRPVNVCENITVMEKEKSQIENGTAQHIFNPSRKHTFSGRVEVIIGPMFASKTSTLLTRCRRDTIGGNNCLMICHPLDRRYSDKPSIATHDGIVFSAVRCTEEDSIMTMYSNAMFYDSIYVDEAQFYSDIAVFSDKLASLGKKVVCSGLYADYRREPFVGMVKLLAVADRIDFFTAIDPINGEDAPFTVRIRPCETDDSVCVGGAEMYRPVSRSTLFKTIKAEDRIENLTTTDEMDTLSIKQRSQLRRDIV